MTDVPPSRKRLTPVPVRMTLEKQARLDRDKGGLSRNAYINWCVFEHVKPARGGLVDRKAIAMLIAKFGQSRIPNNLNQLARAANSGSLVLTPELEAELREACSFVADIRSLLIRAQNLADGSS